MKYKHNIFSSEYEAIMKIIGFEKLKTEKINKPFHHKERVRLYSGTELLKKYRTLSHKSIIKTYKEANSYVNLNDIHVNTPKLFGIIHSDNECSLLLEYIKSKPLTSYLISSNNNLEPYFLTGKELGKMYENKYLHGDLTSYHILINGKAYLFDLENTKQYTERNEFNYRLIKEWTKFIDSSQGRRWYMPFNKKQEEIIFEGIKETLKNRETIKILKNLILKKNYNNYS